MSAVLLPFPDKLQRLTQEETKLLAKAIADDAKDVALPQFYTTAVHALANCEKLDEAERFIGVADMIGSYANQAKDQRMLILSRRINARAWRRLGELLLQFPQTCQRKTGGPKGRRTVALEMGLSLGTIQKAIRIGRIPLDLFEDAVESEESASGHQLVLMDRGKELDRRDRVNSRHSLKSRAAKELKKISAFSRNHAPANLAKCLTATHAEELVAIIEDIRDWLAEIDS
jgi:hypothetical protein